MKPGRQWWAWGLAQQRRVKAVTVSTALALRRGQFTGKWLLISDSQKFCSLKSALSRKAMQVCEGKTQLSHVSCPIKGQLSCRHYLFILYKQTGWYYYLHRLKKVTNLAQASDVCFHPCLMEKPHSFYFMIRVLQAQVSFSLSQKLVGVNSCQLSDQIK